MTLSEGGWCFNERALCVCVCRRWHQIQLTGEQQQILCHDIQRDHVVKIIAFAGTALVLVSLLQSLFNSP